jgi:L-ascorbate metabolism protein UlaG (beta-lactamase superfamily)
MLAEEKFMKKLFHIVIFCSLVTSFSVLAQEKIEEDVFTTSAGELTIGFIGHGSLMFAFDGRIIHIDPVSRVADYTHLPKADLILITHHHGDHLDPNVIETLRTDSTRVVSTRISADQISDCIVLANGESQTVGGLEIEAHPAYNLVHKRANGQPYHPKGEGNSYVITFGDMRIYIGGDTENTPEMKALHGIDIAFLPMNMPYTMTPEMVTDAARAFKPKILYPYHTGNTDLSRLLELMKDEQQVEIRFKNMI